MSGRPIYRPNSFTPEDWERLSREEQIQWWKGQRPKPRPISPLETARLFHRGLLTASEAQILVFENLTEENGQEFLAGCLDSVLQFLRQTCSSLPANGDAKGWSQIVCIEGVCYAPWVTEEEILRGRQERDRRYREGVRVFRKIDPG